MHLSKPSRIHSGIRVKEHSSQSLCIRFLQSGQHLLHYFYLTPFVLKIIRYAVTIRIHWTSYAYSKFYIPSIGKRILDF